LDLVAHDMGFYYICGWEVYAVNAKYRGMRVI